MLLNNPYSPWRVNTAIFYGRETILAALIDDLEKGRSCAVVGGRRIGKTTLLRVLESKLLERVTSSISSGYALLPIYVDVLSVSTDNGPGEIYRFITARIIDLLVAHRLVSEELRKDLEMFDTTKGEESRVFATLLNKWLSIASCACYVRIAVIFDEVAPIVKSAWGNRFFGNWRHLLNNSPDISRNLSAVFSGAKEMQELYEDVGSPIGNILTWHSLALFGWPDTWRLIVEPSGRKLTDRDCRRIYLLTGGHPFLIQFIMHQLWDKSSASGDVVSESVLEFHQTQSQQFQNWVEKLDPTDRRVYQYLASQKRARPKKELVELVGDIAANRAVNVLCHTGIAVKHPTKNEHYRTAGTMFRAWFLQEVSQEAPLSPSQYAAWIISVHGIRTRGTWQKDITQLLNSEGLKHAPFDYGFFGALKLLVPSMRRRQIKDFALKYWEHVSNNGPRPSVIAHSFGTYLICHAMQKYSEVEFDQVILCGSIVREDFDWTIRIPSQANRVLNDVGQRDIWARLARWFVEDAGASGSLGFKDNAGGQVFHRRHADFRHSDFFNLLNWEKNWIPFLQGVQPTESAIEKPRAPNWRFRTTLLLLLLVLAILFAFWTSFFKRL